MHPPRPHVALSAGTARHGTGPSPTAVGNVPRGGMPRTVPRLFPVRPSMKVKTGIKSGGESLNHNEAQAQGLKVKTGIKAGAGSDKLAVNHNEVLVRRD